MFFTKDNVIRKATMMAMVFAAVFMAGWLVLPTNGAEAANRYRVGTGDWNTTASWSATSGGVGGEL